jgi:hypothetical protein
VKKAIFTVITGGYDKPQPPPNFKGWDSIMFSDYDHDTGWDMVEIDATLNPFLQSRKYKMLSHLYLDDYDLVCYIDGNQKLLREPPSHPIWFKHDRRKDIFEEGEQLIKNGRYTAEQINSHLDYIRSLGFRNRGLYLNGFFVRDHSYEINLLHECWYSETAKHSHRDQLTLPVAIWITKVFPKNIQPEKMRHNYSHVVKPH